VTLSELLETVSSPSNKQRVVAVLYHAALYNPGQLLTAEGIKGALQHARIAGATRMNVFDVLAKCGGLVDSKRDEGGRRVWKLTKSGETYAQTIFGQTAPHQQLPDLKALTSTYGSVKDEHARQYVEEALVCLGVGALRAAVVFLWTGAMCELHNVLLKADRAELNRVLAAHDPKSRTIKLMDDFAYVRDSNAILAAQGLGIIDKGQRQALEEGLQLRNRCGHPTQYRPGINKVVAFAEDVASILFAEHKTTRAA
jgi:hypothetical protein